MIVPYRAKNPPEHFPVFTIALIAINVLIFALTSHKFLVIREDIVQNYAVSHDTLSLWRLLTSLFLHEHILHLGFNMLALWLFGASVEGRVRPLQYLALYFVSGLAGGLLSDMVTGIGHPQMFSLGASGAIMGMAGAYLYMFPYSLICIYWRVTFFVRGIMEWQARWVVALYIGMDLLFALLFRGADGVGHFAHLGGFAAGLLGAFLLRAPRDNEEISNVQAVLDEMKDYSLLSLNDLEVLIHRPTQDMNVILAYLEKAGNTTSGRAHNCLAVIHQHSNALITQGDPNRLAQLVLNLPISVGGLPPLFYLRLAARLEQMASNDLAAQLYRRIYDLSPASPDTEVALYRLGQLMERAFSNQAQAQAIYAEMLRLFPNGNMAAQARRALQQSPAT